MFPSRFFPNRYYAPRYWPKVGATAATVARVFTYIINGFLLMLLVPAVVWAQPYEAEPIPDWQWAVHALMGFPPADVPSVVLDLPSYTVRVGYLFSADVVATDAVLAANAEGYRADLERAFARSRSTGPEILVEMRWTRVAYTASTSDNANFSWLQQQLFSATPVNLWGAANATDHLQIVTANGGPSAGLGTLNAANWLTSISWVSFHQAGSWANYSAAHEVLHNWGAHHRRADGAVNGSHAEGYGWTNGSSKRTLMAYCCGVREQISNPAVMFLGTATPSGTATDNNMAVVARRAAFVSAFRVSSSAPAPRPAGIPTMTEE